MKQQNNRYLSFKEEAKTITSDLGFRVILEEENFTYNRAKRISNSYFDHHPSLVTLPRSNEQVVACLQQYLDFKQQTSDLQLRVCSGGHQHEGMSSGDGVYMIRLSEFNTIEFTDSTKTKAWIGAGCKLGDVYAELALHHKIIPGGGCMNVNVGGLTQGGGWGMNSRIYGMTCDNIEAAEVVTIENGKAVQVITSQTQHPELFWAIRGGGGGNFGIVTRFLFKTREISPVLSTYRFGWKKEDAEKVIVAWLKFQRQLNQNEELEVMSKEDGQKYTVITNNLTFFLRLTVAHNPKEGEKNPRAYPVYSSGSFHGSKKELKALMQLLSKQVEPAAADFEEIVTAPTSTPRGLASSPSDTASSVPLPSLLGFLDYDRGFHMNVGDFIADLNDGGGITGKSTGNTTINLPKPPLVNCSAPHPHKVSSAFSIANKEGKNEYYTAVAKNIADYIKASTPKATVRAYMTFHAMGGAIRKAQQQAFPFAEREFLLQFQTWWNYPNNFASLRQKNRNGTIEEKEKEELNQVLEEQKPFVKWVTDFRKTLHKEKLVDHAFINFVDKDLYGPYQDTPENRYQLLQQYYPGKLDKLIDIKGSHDTENIFHFPMSIPTEKPH